MWPGCTTSDAGGRCRGVIRVKTNDRFLEYAVMSCNDARKVTYEHCVAHPDVQCVDDGFLVCMKYRVWALADCSGDLTDEISIYSWNCKNKF